ncbi:hypothetical protein ACBR40_07625 [Nonomuraea sp. AD125B]|uniref:hypothetical protein n=1 Tax=Nonomuraea sp. AD125B TaxID=3242897 RepID=UPI003527AF9C
MTRTRCSRPASSSRPATRTRRSLRRTPGACTRPAGAVTSGCCPTDSPNAEEHLKTALDLAPGDKETNHLLGDCYIRQDKFALSAPHWKAAGEGGYAKWFTAVSGEAYQIHGGTARVPFQQMDPMPLVEVSVNDGPAKRFTFYTGAPA